MSVLLRRSLGHQSRRQVIRLGAEGSASSPGASSSSSDALATILPPPYRTRPTQRYLCGNISNTTFRTFHAAPIASTAALQLTAPTSSPAHRHHASIPLPQFPYTHNRIQPTAALSAVRHFHLSTGRFEQASSKVEETVKAIQERKADPGAAAVAAANGTDAAVAKQVVKKSLGTRVWDEVLHYYHGFRLLFLDINVARKLLWKTIRGTTLTRREYMLLIRTTGDVFRLVPFSVFIIIPFMELLLPVFIKFFPGMLPSTFQTAKDVEDKARQNLKVKLEMAKFLQKTLDEMDVHNSNHSSEEAREFIEFFKKLRTSGEHATPEEIMRFSKLFEDEITLDSLSLPQLAAICRVLEVPTYGTSAMLRYQLRMKLRSLAADDRMIQKEGVDTLSLAELQAASRARGMRSYGLTLGKLREQISEWIHLSLNEKVPPSLLLLSRAMMLPEDVTTSEKLKASMTVLSESAAIQTQAAIGEREGKIDNRTKIEIIRDEQRKIKEELEEQKQVEKADEEMVDQAKVLATAATASGELGTATITATATAATTAGAVSTGAAKVTTPTPKDVAADVVQMSAKEVSDVVTEAIGAIGAEKKTLLVEKEEIKDLKEEIAEYKEDVEELNMISKTVEKPTIKESNASKNLLKKVDSMISKLDQVLANLDAKEAKLKATLAENQDAPTEELVRIDEIISAIRKMQKVPDESKLVQIEKILGRIDDDKDGNLKVDDVVRIIQEIGKESVSLNEKQVEELMTLITKEEQIENEEKIKKALAKSLEEERLQKAAKAASDAEELSDNAPKVLGSEQKSEELTDAGTKVLSDETKKPAGEKLPSKLNRAVKAMQHHDKKIDERIVQNTIDSVDQLADKIPPLSTGSSGGSSSAVATAPTTATSSPAKRASSEGSSGNGKIV